MNTFRKNRQSGESLKRSKSKSINLGYFQNVACVKKLLLTHLDLVLSGGIAFVFMLHLFLTDECFLGFGSDIIGLHNPMHTFAINWLKQGILPLWNPYIFGGVPFQAGVHGYLYPGFWTALVLPSGFDVKLVITVHLIVASSGGTWLARGHVHTVAARVLVGVVFALSGFMTLHLFAGHKVMVMTAAYLPWAAGSLWRLLTQGEKHFFRATIIWTLMLLAGHYQIVYIAALGTFSWLTIEVFFGEVREADGTLKQRLIGLLRCVFAVLIALGVSAIQLVPALINTGYSQRAGDSVTFSTSYSSPPINMLSYLFPNIFGNGVDAVFVGDWSFWESNGYFGTVPLLLIVIAVGVLPWRRVVAKVVLVLFALMLCFGEYTCFFDLFLYVIPGADLFRAPGRFCILIALFGGLISAQVVDHICRGELARINLGRFGAAIGFPLLAGGLIALWFLSWRVSDYASWWIKLSGHSVQLSADTIAELITLVETDLSIFLFSVGLVGGFCSLARFFPGLGRSMAIGILLVVTADIYHFGHRFFKTGDRSLFGLPTALEDRISRDNVPGFRVIPPAIGWYANFPMMLSVGNPGGYDIFLEQRYAEYMNVSQKREKDTFLSYERLLVGSSMIRHLGPRYLFTSMPLRNGKNRIISGYDWMAPAGKVDRYYLYEDNNPVPRAFLVHAVRAVPNRDDRLDILASRGFDIRQEALLDADHEGIRPKPSPNGQDEAAQLTRLEPNSVEIAVNAASDAVLVMSDTLMPGWTATVDGHPAPMVHANHIMRAVPVPKGEHVVRMAYLPQGVVVGGMVSVVGILVLIGGVVWLRRR